MVTPSLKAMENQGVEKRDLIANRIPKRLYTLKEAAAYLGRGVHGVRDMIWRNEIAYVRGGYKGRKMFVDVKDLDGWIERNKQTYL
jgi:excisionase family DNA binding protein